MFTREDFAHLAFLDGRWRGVGPDGAPFYEAYDFVDPATFRSRRYTDDRFTTAADGSTVAFADGVVTATWGPFTWTAVDLTPDRACFAPVAAPSAFCWERTGAGSVTVTQRWTDDAGVERHSTMPLVRVA
jgi:hypothetical protein